LPIPTHFFLPFIIHHQLSTMSDELPSIEVVLEQTGDKGSGYKFLNEWPDQLHRPKIVDQRVSNRTSDNRLQGYLTSVIHGHLDGPGSDPATLILAHFRFLSVHENRKFRSASIDFYFPDFDAKATEYGPEVIRIAPDGRTLLDPSTNQYYRIDKVGGRAGGGVGGFKAGVYGETEVGSFQTLKNNGLLVGSSHTTERNRGPENTASWAMSENKATSSGIPNELHVAILLQREDDRPFFAAVDVMADVDWLYEATMLIRGLRGQLVIDPINFAPKRQKVAGKIPEGIDPERLGSVVLSEFCHIELI
jgi:hypothetical protein